ncbi:vanillate O-demethylase monooxygenase subunit [Novosphingobium sp. SG919]|nr:vanillate O-demethylase monooxygenase subunit [Novosphingobium sp. SG919]
MATALIAPDEPALPHGCTFAPKDWAILAQHWYPVALAREVGEAPLKAKLLDQPLLLYRAQGGIVIAPDRCPHRGVPLSMGRANGQGVECPYHGLTFGAAGRCVHIPAQPHRSIPAQFHLATYPAVERYGLVWTCLDPAAGEPGPDAIIAVPHWDEPGFQQIVCPWIDIHGSAGRQMEGFLDVAHFAFIHTESFADPDNAQVPDYRPRRTLQGFEAEYWSNVANYPKGVDKAPAGFRWLRHFRCHAPFTATLEVHFPGSDRLVILNAASPMSATQTRLFVPIARNFDTDQPVQGVYDFNRQVFEEDKAMVEAQWPARLPLEPTAEAHLAADMSSMFYRRALRDMGLSGG